MQYNSSFMDIPGSQYSESKSFFFHPPKSSSPIEIPGRHDDEPEYTSERTTSPELIFEMEPFSPLDRSTNYSSGSSTSTRTARKKSSDDRELPLLYSFPVVTRLNTDCPHPTPQSPASLSLPPISHHPPTTRAHRRTRTLQLKSPRQTPPCPAAITDPAHAIRVVPLHKITGFKPDFAAQAPPETAAGIITKAPREKALAPPPRRSATRSFSAAARPWRLDVPSDDELARSLDVDAGGAGDFTQYLLRRIDSQKPLQFQAFRAMAMSVSVR
ncbi:hypothetical protein DFH08DRAFT_169827 [Mycena albidolilacea]|uniref:Uncharacterized protein n=1 Tax=Mycena albidolilacea TaxID=1033008 RepID=A0AAD7ARK8_9AGAR|nr:hypothetical protein DFH08DRAFT_169827 [Mycena albidolilacea]